MGAEDMMEGEGGRALPVILSLMTCFYVDFPDTENRTHCSEIDAAHCVHCPILGQFVTGESMEEYGGGGHITCFSLSIFGFIIGLFGAVTNTLIIIILGSQKSRRAFDILLMTLAWCDMFCSVATIISAMSIIAYFQNISRGVFNMYVVYIATLGTLFGRSLSSFITVLIAVERYLVLVFPLKANEWFTRPRIRLMSISVVVFSTIMAIPRYSSIYVTENEVGKDVPGMKNFKYIFFPTRLEYFWYVTLGGFFDTVDFWLPLPLLLLFNGLVFMHIRRFEKRRQEINKKLRKDINATKMFVPVVIVLFLCNIEPIFHYFFIITGTIYREHYCGVMVSLAINSAANLPIYYFRGTSFKREAKTVASSWFPSLVHPTAGGASETGATGTGTSKSDGKDSVDMAEARV